MNIRYKCIIQHYTEAKIKVTGQRFYQSSTFHNKT